MTTSHPAAAGLDPLAEIAAHSAGLADAATGNLHAPVRSCPGWTVADLVWHVSKVHWFWGTIAAERLSEPPGEDRQPARPQPEQLIAAFLAGADRLVSVLGSAEQSAAVWTWAPTQRDVAFITRHQVQEAAVHHWDAEDAAGRSLSFEAPMAIDSIEEFLTFSTSTVHDHPDVARPDLGGALVLAASDGQASWTIRDGTEPGTVEFERGRTDPALPTVSASASDLLLWLYRRVELPVTATDADAAEALLSRFRNLSFTD
jgi:uncharacterized protein (TIGR03083 family)